VVVLPPPHSGAERVDLRIAAISEKEVSFAMLVEIGYVANHPRA